MTTELEKMYEFIENSTYIQNINNGRVEVKEHFGATSQAGMAYPRDTLYNNMEKKSSNKTNINKDSQSFSDVGLVTDPFKGGPPDWYLNDQNRNPPPSRPNNGPVVDDFGLEPNDVKGGGKGGSTGGSTGGSIR